MDAERTRLVALTGDGNTADVHALNATLCALIADGKIATDDPALRDHLLRSVLARMAIDNPKYPSLKVVAQPD